MLEAVKIAQSICGSPFSHFGRERDWLIKAVADSKRYSKNQRLIWAMMLTAWGF